MTIVMPEGMLTIVSAELLTVAGILKPLTVTALFQSRRLTSANTRLVTLPDVSTVGLRRFSLMP